MSTIPPIEPGKSGDIRDYLNREIVPQVEALNNTLGVLSGIVADLVERVRFLEGQTVEAPPRPEFVRPARLPAPEPFRFKGPGEWTRHAEYADMYLSPDGEVVRERNLPEEVKHQFGLTPRGPEPRIESEA